MASILLPKTWAAGDPDTAATWNKEVRDKLIVQNERPFLHVAGCEQTSLASGARNQLTWTRAIEDSSDLHRTYPSQYKGQLGYGFLRNGLWNVRAQVAFVGNATGQRGVYVMRGGDYVARHAIDAPGGGGGTVQIDVDIMITSAISITWRNFFIYALQNSGVSLGIDTSPDMTWAQITWLEDV